jgi:octaprenyl-diphosphate synthase
MFQSAELKDLDEALKPEIDRFKKEFREYLKSGIFLIDQINRFIMRGQGKYLRPILTLLSAKLVGQVSDLTIKAALIVELLHNATLVHDDVVDESDKRRGFPTVKKIWNNKLAVLYGDYLLANSFKAMLELRDMAVFEILSVTARRLAKGELVQTAKTRKLDITEEDYFQIISDKTAALMSASAELGALTGGGDNRQQRALKLYGENVGIAFQIRDDLLDFTGNEWILGKPVGLDLKEKKITLPLIYTLNTIDEASRNELLDAIKKRDGLKKVLKFVENNNGVEYAQNKANKYADTAKEQLTGFEDCQEKELLFRIADYALWRNK